MFGLRFYNQFSRVDPSLRLKNRSAPLQTKAEVEGAYQSEEEVQVRVPPGLEYDDIDDLPPASYQQRYAVTRGGTHAEDGTNCGSLNGRPNEPLDDRVGL